MRVAIALCGGVLFFSSNCLAIEAGQERDSRHPSPATTGAQAAYIGNAWMKDDHEIILQLFAREDQGISGQALFRYKPDHPQYDALLRHLGGLKPGERKGVLPWGEIE